MRNYMYNTPMLEFERLTLSRVRVVEGSSGTRVRVSHIGFSSKIAHTRRSNIGFA